MMVDLTPLAQNGAEKLINGAVYGSAVALLLWIAQPRLRRYDAGARFAILFLALLIVGLCPLLLARPEASAAHIGSSAELFLPAKWASWLLLVWVFGACLGLTRVAWSLLRLRQLSVSAQPVTELPGAVRASLAEFGCRGASVSVSDKVRVPTAVGIFAPTVIFPAWALRNLSAGELNAILLHELAHLRRWDDWTNLAQQIVKALLFFHPAVWWIESKLALEREIACDAFVIEKTENASGYANCLVSLAEHSIVRHSTALAQAAVGKVKQISVRVSRVLEIRSARSLPSRTWLAAGVAAATAGVIVAASFVPELIAFRGAGTAAPSVADSKPPISVTPTLASITQVSVTQKHVIGKTVTGKQKRPVAVRGLVASAPSTLDATAPVPVIEAGLRLSSCKRSIWSTTRRK